MMRLSVGHLESTGYDMMFGDANKTKEFKNWMRLRSEGQRTWLYCFNGNLAGEFFLLMFRSIKVSPSTMHTLKFRSWSLKEKSSQYLRI